MYQAHLTLMLKNGTYNKRLTDEEKDMGVIELRRYLFRNN